MESTLFTTLTPNEEANLSGGTSTKSITALILSIKSSVAKNTVTQTATGGAGGNGGAITIVGGKNVKDSAVVIVDAKFNSSGGKGGDAINSSDNAVGAG
jgi:hypothetical protein